MTIRCATPADENAADQVVGTGEMLEAALFGPDPVVEALIAELDEGPAGFALFYTSFSTWQCVPGIWLEDLVVTARRRSQGIGRRLLDAATAWARDRGCTHLLLNSAVTRTDAHRFYLASGMTQTSLNFGREIER